MKLKQFQKYIKEKKIDLVLLTQQDLNITYFTQIKPSTSLFLIYQKKKELFLTTLDKKPKIKDIKIKSLIKNWQKELPIKKIKKIGINKGNLTVSSFEKIKKMFPKVKFTDISKVLKELRAQKTKEEIKKIQQAAKITDFAFSELINNWNKKKFKTEQDVALFLEQKMKDKNAEPAFPTIVATAQNSAIPHHITSNCKLKKGFLLLDFGSSYKNYCSDMSRTIYLGQPTKKEQKHYLRLLNVQEETIKMIKKDIKFSELDKFTRKKLDNLSSYFIHSLGHGIGLEVHEHPVFQTDKIKQNQVFTIEPGIYFHKEYGIRIEDTLIYNRKVKILTKSTKKLLKLII